MATDERLLYEAHSALVPWTGRRSPKDDDDHKALHFIIEDRNCDIFLCQADAQDLVFWQALASMWERAPLMQLRLKEARDAIAALPPGVLGIAYTPYIGQQYTNWYVRDELLGNIERALREDKGE